MFRSSADQAHARGAHQKNTDAQKNQGDAGDNTDKDGALLGDVRRLRQPPGPTPHWR